MKHLIGNETVAETLSRFMRIGRIPNALLFAGPEGVGKKQFAIEVARGLVCTCVPAGEGCGECAPCRRAGEFAVPALERGEDSDRVFFSQHPDVGLVVPYKRNLRIGAIRALEREANFRPYEAGARVFIIDDADKMNDPSSNALLKTLEEPPETTHIILIASRFDTLLPTIRSRCQTIRFGPVDIQAIEDHLTKSGEFSPDDAAIAARASGGSVARALGIVPAALRTQRGAMLDVVKAAIGSDARELLRVSEEMNDARNKDEFDENLEILEGLVHDLWLLVNSASRTEIKNVDLAADLEKLSAQTTSTTLAGWLAELELMQQNFVVNINRRIATDSLFVKMAAG